MKFYRRSRLKNSSLSATTRTGSSPLHGDDTDRVTSRLVFGGIVVTRVVVLIVVVLVDRGRLPQPFHSFIVASNGNERSNFRFFTRKGRLMRLRLALCVQKGTQGMLRGKRPTYVDLISKSSIEIVFMLVVLKF